MHWNRLRSRLVRSTGVVCIVGVLAAMLAAGALATTGIRTIDTIRAWDGADGDISLEGGGDLAFKAVLSTADAGGTGWVTANVHSRGTVTRDGLAEVKVTYRCQLPGDNTGSTEGYRVLQQHPGTSREVWDDGYDVDEFWCDGSRFTVPHAFSSETGRFHRGWAWLTLDIRVCTGDVTDDPGTCFPKVVKARVWLRSVR